MERGKLPSSGRGAKSKVPQHPQDIFALGSKSTVVVSRDSEKRNIHKPSTSGVERKRETSGFGNAPPSKRTRIGSPAEAVGAASLEIDPVDLVPNVLQALDTHNSDKLLGLLTGSIRLLKSQRSKPDPILCMSMLYLTKIRPNMFAHDTVTQSLCTLLKREQGAAFKNKGNPLVFVLACNMLYAGHRDSSNWPDTFIKVYIEDALNERCWVECSWCKCLVENIVTAFSTKHPPPHLIPTDNTLAGTMSPSGSGSPLMGSNEEDPDNIDLEYSVFPRYSSSYEQVETLVLEAIKEQLQRRAAPDAVGKQFLKLLSATCGFPEIRVIAASRLEAWLHSGKLWRAAQQLLAHVCCNADASGPAASRDHEVLAQLARMRLKTKPLQAAYQACLREMVSDSPALLRSVVTHTIYNELSNVRSPNNMAVLAALIQAQPQLVPAAMADTYKELLVRPEDYLRPLRALTRECVRAARADAAALLPLARALAHPPHPQDPPAEIRERAFSALADLFCVCCLVTATHSKHLPEYRQQLCGVQAAALGWLLDTAVPLYRCTRHDYQHALNKIMFVETAETYSKPDNWPPEAERALAHRLCCEAPLPQNTLLRIIFIGLSKEIPVGPAEVLELVEQVVRRACALPPEDAPLQVDKLEIVDYIFQLCQFHPPDNITLPAGYTPAPLVITSLYWRAWVVLVMLAAHNAHGFAERSAHHYPTLRALIETTITNKPSIEWASGAEEAERGEAERAAVLQLETHLAAASNAKLPITDHNSRLLTQLTTLDPTGPARRPPAAVLEQLQQLNSSLRLGRLLCRQPALLLDLVERHGTRRAMPWLHQLLRHDQLELSVLPVQCLCEFLSAGGAGGAGGAGEGGKMSELAAHLRRTVRESAEGARAVLHYYAQRLAHHHASTRAHANRGLKIVLSTAEDTADMDYNADVSPEEWLGLVSSLQHWESVREEMQSHVRAACLVECVPAHLAAYVAFLADLVDHQPLDDHTPIVLDLSQVVMERMSVTGSVLPPAELREPTPPPRPHHHRTLHALHRIFYAYMRKVRASSAEEPSAASGASGPWPGGECVSLQWPSWRATLPLIIAHASLKLLCYGPSIYDTDQEMYSWLISVWVGAESPAAFALESTEEAVLLPDWLRLHLVRSARPPLLSAGLRSLPAHKLALFIQTFGMPVASMSALLSALDACPAGAVVRLGVERAYMAQLLRVQRARGARGGDAFAAALRLHDVTYPPDEDLFAEEPLPSEPAETWGAVPAEGAPVPPPDALGALLGAALTGRPYRGDLDADYTLVNGLITDEVRSICEGASVSSCPYVAGVLQWMWAGRAALGAGLLQRPAYSVPLLRALTHVRTEQITQLAHSLATQLAGVAGPVASAVRALAQRRPERPGVPPPAAPPVGATKEQLINALESATPSTLEALGRRVLDTHDTGLVVDVLSQILENSQQGKYDLEIKGEEGGAAATHVLGSAGLGCGLVLDWVSGVRGEHHLHHLRLMFGRGRGARWRPLLVTLLAHRASWTTLHRCLAVLLEHNDSDWSAGAVLDFVETLVKSPRVWQGRDKSTPKHHVPEDTLRLSHTQLEVVVRYICAEAGAEGDAEAARRRVEARLPLLLRCCPHPHQLLAAALAADHPMLLLLLYMKVPKVLQLLRECDSRGGRGAGGWRPSAVPGPVRAAAARSTSAADRVSHALLTAVAAASAAHLYTKEHTLKVSRMEAGVRAVWARVGGAGARALPLVGALLRGAPPQRHAPLLAALELLSDQDLFHDPDSEEMHSILEYFLGVVRAQGGGRDSALSQRVAALLRRYLAARPARAALLLQRHRETIAGVPALSAVRGGGGGLGGAEVPARALAALRARARDADVCAALGELEAWGARRGAAWGGPSNAQTLVCAVSPLCAAGAGAVRGAALALLARLLPAATDPTPGFNAILECLESEQPQVAQSALDKLPELVVGMQEHATLVLMKVFELGVKSRHPVEQCIAKCVNTINLHRGC